MTSSQAGLTRTLQPEQGQTDTFVCVNAVKGGQGKAGCAAPAWPTPGRDPCAPPAARPTPCTAAARPATAPRRWRSAAAAARSGRPGPRRTAPRGARWRGPTADPGRGWAGGGSRGGKPARQVGVFGMQNPDEEHGNKKMKGNANLNDKNK